MRSCHEYKGPEVTIGDHLSVDSRQYYTFQSFHISSYYFLNIAEHRWQLLLVMVMRQRMIRTGDNDYLVEDYDFLSFVS